MLLFKQCIEKRGYKAVIPQLSALVPSSRDTLHRCWHISMWGILKSIVWGFDDRVCYVLHTCWACLESFRLVSMFEDFKKKETRINNRFTRYFYCLFPASMFLSWNILREWTCVVKNKRERIVRQMHFTGSNLRQSVFIFLFLFFFKWGWIYSVLSVVWSWRGD